MRPVWHAGCQLPLGRCGWPLGGAVQNLLTSPPAPTPQHITPLPVTSSRPPTHPLPTPSCTPPPDSPCVHALMLAPRRALEVASRKPGQEDDAGLPAAPSQGLRPQVRRHTLDAPPPPFSSAAREPAHTHACPSTAQPCLHALLGLGGCSQMRGHRPVFAPAGPAPKTQDSSGRGG